MYTWEAYTGGDDNNLSQVEGLVKCKILPPRDFDTCQFLSSSLLHTCPICAMYVLIEFFFTTVSGKKHIGPTTDQMGDNESSFEKVCHNPTTIHAIAIRKN